MSGENSRRPSDSNKDLQAAIDRIAALERALSSIPIMLYGSGSPQGVVVGLSGQYYTDTTNNLLYVYNAVVTGTTSWTRATVAFGQYGPNGSANGRSPTSDFAWNFLRGSSNWNATYATLSTNTTTNDRLTFNVAGIYRIEAGVRYNPSTSYAQTELIVAGVGQSKHFASGNGITSGYASGTVLVAANAIMTVTFASRGASETIYEVAGDTSNWMNIQYLGI